MAYLPIVEDEEATPTGNILKVTHQGAESGAKSWCLRRPWWNNMLWSPDGHCAGTVHACYMFEVFS